MVEAGQHALISGPVGAPRLCYVLEAFPVLSQTFVWNEILAVRQAGAAVSVAYLNRVRTERGEPAVQALLAEALNLGGWLGWRERLRNRLALIARGPTRARRARAGFAGDGSRDPGMAERLAAQVLRSGASHIHAHFGGSASRTAMAASALTGVPFSFTMHGSDVYIYPPDDLAEQCERASFVITVSEANRTFLLEQRGLPAAKVRVVRNGIRVGHFTARPPAPPHESARLLTVARLHPVKGLDVMLDALHALRDMSWQWTVVGDGPEHDTLVAQARRLGLSDRVHFAGARPHHDLPSAYQEADVFVLPSRSEGLPVVLMEAMASALPVVATRVGGVAEIVDDGVSGSLVPADDPASLADALRQVLSDPVRAMRMGHANRAKAAQAFSIDEQAKALMRLWFAPGVA